MSFPKTPSITDALVSTEEKTTDSKSPSKTNQSAIDKNVTSPENNPNLPSVEAAATQLLDLRSNEDTSNVMNESSSVPTTSMAVITMKLTEDIHVKMSKSNLSTLKHKPTAKSLAQSSIAFASSKRKKITIEESSDSDTDYSASKQDSVVLRKGKTSVKPTSQRPS